MKKVWNGYMNNGDYDGWIDELVIAETKEEAIQILKDKYPYRVGMYSFGAREFKIEIEGYEVEITVKQKGR